ncbi:MAG: DNA-binding protein WhiA [bacterium]|nr:DNA-binding protein WhiA [bacterium]
MSFSGTVKEELSKQTGTSRHCMIAETAAMIMCCGKISRESTGGYRIRIQTEKILVARKVFTLLRKTFNIYTNVCVRTHARVGKSPVYEVSVNESKDVNKVLMAIKYMDEQGRLLTGGRCINSMIVQQTCCRRAFIRGSFLSAGSISNPEKSYHFEIVCETQEMAEQIRDVINTFSLDAKTVQRKRYYIVYLKEGAQIVEVLNIMGAHIALMDLENMRIVKEVRNSVNRRVNCETANIGKTVSAAVKQLEDIQYLIAMSEFGNLPPGLREIAQARLDDPNATLAELGESLTPAIGKSGVNHRLRKLSELADRLRGQKEEHYYDSEANINSIRERTGGQTGSSTGTGGKSV